jgi:iron complex transport system ATP-binding protein
MLYSGATTSARAAPVRYAHAPVRPRAQPDPPVLLDARDLRFSYGSRETGPAVDGVTVGVEAGAIVGLLGPNGSGKTTLIKLLSGALTPGSGALTLDDQALTSIPRAALARRVAVVPQETHLAFDYTVLEIVLMGRYPRLRAFEIEGPADVRCAMDALAATGTEAFAARPFPTLSGGEKQRVIIASALAQLDDRSRSAPAGPSPGRSASPLLFLDEPTASLDLRYQLELVALLTRLNRELGLTMVLSTHDLRLARSVCTKVVLLANGRVLAHGTPADTLTPPLLGRLYGVDAVLVAQALA